MKIKRLNNYNTKDRYVEGYAYYLINKEWNNDYEPDTEEYKSFNNGYNDAEYDLN